MTITIKKNHEIKLDIPSFSCDNDAVGPHLNDHPLTSLLNIYGFTCLIGKPGQGKTSFAIAMITQKTPKIYRKTSHHVLIIMPANSIGSLKKNPFKCLPDDHIYNELTDQSIHQIYNRIDDASKK